MRVMILSQHYVPEVTAARFRVEAFVEALTQRGHEVDVVAPLPNYPEGVVLPEFRGRTLVRSKTRSGRVSYVWSYTSPEKNALRRLAFYGSYVATATLAGGLSRRPDIVLATSPPLSVAVAGALVSARHRVPWVFDVRDLWPLAAQVMGELTSPRMIEATERLERWLYRDADAIVAVTSAFVEHITARIEDEGKVALIRNGTTENWLHPPPTSLDRRALGLAEDRFVWAYAGNLGPSRRLDVAIEAARRLGDRFQFVIAGDGGAREDLEASASSLGDGQVIFTGLLEPAAAVELLRACDALLVPQRRGLGDFIPSKLFDYAATGLPLIVMADGETSELAGRSGAALRVEPDDTDGLMAALGQLAADEALCARLGEAGISFSHAYSRSGQAELLVDLLERQVAKRS